MEKKNQKADRKKQKKTMGDFEKKRKQFDKSARLIAIVLIGVMLIFTFITAGLFILE
ncbi:MAG TPA: hypothetical protein GX736_06430 [Mogibacterium sp.]|nr:hypothetical protein [Mogibacterium sp.]